MATISSQIPPNDPQPRFYAVGTHDAYAMKKLWLFLEASRPVIVTMTTDQEFRGATNISGLAIVEHNPDSIKNIKVHAVLVVGYGVVQNRKYTKFRNSWGKGCGDYGYVWVSEEFFQAHARTIYSLQLKAGT